MCQWDPLIGLGEVATSLALLIAGVGLLQTARQLGEGAKIRRGQFLLEATDRYFADTAVRRLFYDIDYGRFKIQFDEGGEPSTFIRGDQEPQDFVGSDEERHLDSLLYTFDAVGRVVEVGALNRSDAKIFEFQANRVFQDPSVKRLLEWLDGERKRFGGEVPVHKAGRSLASGHNARWPMPPR